MKYRYSVIIPVYNSEKTILRCLNSIQKRRCANTEIIVVNDGSTDQSDEIIREFSERHRDVFYLKKENGGVSSARNAGLDAARGEYVLFVDSDDYVLPNYFEVINHITDNHPVDFIAHCVQNWKEDLSVYTDPEEIAAAISSLEYAGRLAQSPQKVFSRKLIETLHLRFQEDLVIGEDIVFIFAYVLHAKSIAVTKENIYQIVLDNTESLSRKKRTYLCEQSLQMRSAMWSSLEQAELPNHVFNLYYSMFCWSFYHGAYSVCKELLKFDMPPSKRIQEIGNICDRFISVQIVPRDLKSMVLALPIRYKLTWIIYLMILVANKRKH